MLDYLYTLDYTATRSDEADNPLKDARIVSEKSTNHTVANGNLEAIAAEPEPVPEDQPVPEDEPVPEVEPLALEALAAETGSNAQVSQLYSLKGLGVDYEGLVRDEHNRIVGQLIEGDVGTIHAS